jgi:hypothetical protein
MTERDFAAEMRAVLDEHTAKGAYIPRRAAEEIVAKLRVNDPELLEGWLHADPAHFIHQFILDVDRSRRTAARHQQSRGEFADAARRHEAGDTDALTGYLGLRYTVDESNTRKTLGECRGAEVAFVAQGYRDAERENKFHAVLFEKIAKKIGSDTVAEHYDNKQLAAMFGGVRAA